MSSTDCSESEIPDERTCFRLCNEFAELTKTDSACGHFYLQNCGWDLSVAVSYFLDKNKAQSVDDSPPADGPKQFSLLSWNIDGLDPHNVKSRASAVANIILELVCTFDLICTPPFGYCRTMPTAVFLQEVVEENLVILREKLSSEYDELPRETSCNYFTKTFLHRNSANCDSSQVIPFEGSCMGRDMMVAQVTLFGKAHCCLVNAHLESGRQYSKVRKEQLSTAFSLMRAADSGVNILFGGDLNLRDHEVKAHCDSSPAEFSKVQIFKIQTLPEGIVDLWKANGSPSGEKYTWDSTKNDNIASKGIAGRSYRPRCRFDRIYMKHSTPRLLTPTEFKLVGKRVIRSCLCYPSDHFGILCCFQLT
ncbi:5' tyrosyl DNA phosphodiesterase [Trichuris trichiura]|uniref:5' tyrosyl DNA phosphodiesterase n=1 Tax=Trichuris trichiura TaxID=36087 RepID=A0A077Z101_TRITR|nr:5' tyrosyl DNA phosphodiesterase [Trichuris trichiura]